MLRIGRLGLGAEIGLIGTHERFRLATLGDTMGWKPLPPLRETVRQCEKEVCDGRHPPRLRVSAGSFSVKATLSGSSATPLRYAYRTTVSRAIVAQFVAAAEMNWSCPYGKSLSK